MHDLSETPEHRGHEREAVLFNAAVRALGAFGYSTLEFDIGGKKARRRYVSAIAPNGEPVNIWIKSATQWPGLAEAVRFPWKKLSVSPDGLSAISVACEDAAKRGATHFLAIVGNDRSGVLSFARLYSISEVPTLAATQSTQINSVFYRAHSAALILEARAPEFVEAAKAACAIGEDILSAPHREQSTGATQVVLRARSGNVYRRDPRVREQVLKIARGRCECCGELGFLTESGERYLETHHVVGVSERGPDSPDNIVAVCPLCHRKAHFSAEKTEVERKMLEAIRRRGRPSAAQA
ncbi:MAG TPA: HNH endonuclease signature motif containing protein [Pseudomonadales bacterium]|jgi:5-methylcytosine-specific restriction protein A|nr:HNH endonuclease signature motif containing protein [Pseudomonadales bacterium]HMW14896.1 HNH endonuclease signature motif containing protein [Pseudomonadales bacterium]HMW83887.1 HNH endonuclease signature motif containing protein [Pseudomonadales bacterium]HNB84858.1 HNH endonuclease signature motif containing protein [Pseudomonadales bacterium]HNC77739.1 HNH endonuclease signature motif containing protein [Pseudomonadales bacterium]